MKRFLPAFFLLFFPSCIELFPLEDTSLVLEVSDACPERRISSRVYMKDIEAYLENSKGLFKTKGEINVSIEPILSGVDTVFFLVNHEEGWELLAADKRLPFVLMMCMSGHMSKDSLYFNNVQETYLKNIEETTKTLLSSPALSPIEDISFIKGGELHPESLNPHDNEWPYSKVEYGHTYESQGHLIQTKWGQDTPWNYYAPYADSTMTNKSKTGCVMVAAAQMLYFIHDRSGNPFYDRTYPDFRAGDNVFVPTNSYLQLTSSNTLHSATKSDYWNDMPIEWRETHTDYVSSLMIELGYQFEAQYYANSTSASLSHMQSALLQNYNLVTFATTDSTYFAEIIYDQLANYHTPVIARISNINGITSHVIIIDGFYRVYDNAYHYRGRDSGLPTVGDDPDIIWELVSTESSLLQTMVAINWGWDGVGDSYDGSPIWYAMFDDSIQNDWTAGGNTYNGLSALVWGFIRGM